MTEYQKNQIMAMRDREVSYTQIAEQLGLSVNTVKSCCRRCKLEEDVAPAAEPVNSSGCRHCGKPVHSLPGKRARVFCCDACRYAYAYRQGLNQPEKAVCAHCGAVFEYRGKTCRKYCSHACYRTARFGVKTE